jgi:hypothetical protein
MIWKKVRIVDISFSLQMRKILWISLFLVLADDVMKELLQIFDGMYILVSFVDGRLMCGIAKCAIVANTVFDVSVSKINNIASSILSTPKMHMKWWFQKSLNPWDYLTPTLSYKEREQEHQNGESFFLIE